MTRATLTCLCLLSACAWLVAALEPQAQTKQAATAVAARQLPGVQNDGSVLLPNQWSLQPAGRQIELGDFPVNIAVHPSGLWLAVLHAGYGTHEIEIVDIQRARPRVCCRVTLEQAFYGLAFSPDGKHVYASGGEYEVVHEFAFVDGYLSAQRKISIVPTEEKFIPAGLAISPDGQILFAAGTWGHELAVIQLADSGKPRRIALPKESYPYACLCSPTSTRVFVSLWSNSAVAVVDWAKGTIEGIWQTEAHPTEMALSPDGKRLYVACANSTKVSVLDAATGKPKERLSCALYPQAPSGNAPNSLSLTPDGKTLIVANADANNLAVFSVDDDDPAVARGFIPTGWYPTSVRYNPKDRRLYFANGKGESSFANPQGPKPGVPANLTIRQYIAGLFHGTLGYLEMPTTEQFTRLSRRAQACSPLRSQGDVTVEKPTGNPIPGKVGEACPIKYCIYVVKENRTYDQVFGDMRQGNGDADLCLFPEKATPNHHKLVREFVLLDNFYADGEVSANGHEWSMGAYATDFVEKVWPLTYRNSPFRKLGYPAEGVQDAVARPAGGYLWDRCAAAGVSYRSYGEWVENGRTPAEPATARVKALEGHIDPMFRGFDMNYSDQLRADRFLAELARFEKEGEMPRLQIVRLPFDHTSGTRREALTPTAMVADNDLALGRLVEGVSRSRFWQETAIFIVEDDAQNGSDHVDAHRTVALVASPYTRRGTVDSSMYSTSSMLRTMELILGLEPMSQFDAAARPMYHSFQEKADERPYTHEAARVDLKERNSADAFGADLSAKMDFSKEDAVDDLLLNEVIWGSVKGAGSVMPAPVRAAFVRPIAKSDKKDD
jgi:DNA-binding beta-propeller fold protein YncE